MSEKFQYVHRLQSAEANILLTIREPHQQQPVQPKSKGQLANCRLSLTRKDDQFREDTPDPVGWAPFCFSRGHKAQRLLQLILDHAGPSLCHSGNRSWCGKAQTKVRGLPPRSHHLLCSTISLGVWSAVRDISSCITYKKQHSIIF
jgi:hypothetical protein